MKSKSAKMSYILKQNQTSDSDLYKLAKDFGLKNLRVCYSAEVNPTYVGPQIANLDKVGGQGTHWVCYFDGAYFDPLGCPPPPHIDRLHPDYTDIQIQNVHEGHCGSYCILWALAKQKNKLFEFFHDRVNYDR